MATWQLQTAKAKLSELLRAVRDEGPQVISVRGSEEFVVMRREDLPAALLKPSPTSWEELYALAEGAGEHLILPPREIESARSLELGEERVPWAEDE